MLDKKSRLKLLKSLDLSGTEVSDVGLRYVAQYLSQLNHLKLSRCWKVTDAGLAQITSLETLTSLNLSHCKLISNQGLQHLSKCKGITHLDCTNTSVTTDGLKKFIEEISSNNGVDKKLMKLTGHVVAKRQSNRHR